MAENSRKRRRIDPVEICQQVYEVIRNYKKEDGSLLCDAFIRAPKRRQEPAYYDVVSNPIDMLRIQQKIRTDEYEELDQMTADVELLVSNAKAFYTEDKSEHQDAISLWEIYQQTVDRISEDEVAPKLAAKVKKKAASTSPMESEDSEESRDTFSEIDEMAFEELFAAVMHATSSDGRLLHTAFQLLPSKKLYPDYYQVIDMPIDLKQIAIKIQSNEYTNLTEMENDLNLMIRNASAYNEPGSQISKDAKMLRKIITSRKAEIEHSRQTGGKTSERIRSKRAKAAQSLSSITAALQYDDSRDTSVEPDEIDEDGETAASQIRPDDADSSPLWQLFDVINNHTDNLGNAVCQPFQKLPNRRRYADYYREIKNPISLLQIRSKLVRTDYSNVNELAADLSTMFENAKRYNRPDSKLFKDACKLHKAMQMKLQQLLADDDQSSEGEVEMTPKKKGRPRIHPISHKKGGTRGSDSNNGTPTVDTQLRKRLRLLYRCLMDHVQDDGRQPILVFMEKPSKKLYPDYYRVIAEPIDMVTIDSNIKNDRYSTEDELLDDLRLMFNNCRQYNEEGSVIYEDANTLERILIDKSRELGLATAKQKKRRSVPNLAHKLKTLYDAVKDYRDAKNRQLTTIFLKLPSKMEYPDYYEVIKKPIDMEKIGHKVKAAQYDTLEELISDLVLMFDNACRYNEPDSQIYKDALTLQRVALQTKMQLCEDEGWVPDVRAAVQELMTTLFASVYNHQDEEGRCYTDSLAELAEHDEVDGKKVRAISLDLIKRRLDKGMYRRLDIFQEDIFSCFERARRLSRTDSQVFEDSVELQSHFIRQRDELCRNGDVLSSPALSFSVKDLTAMVDVVRQEKLLKEQPEEEVEVKDKDSPAVSAGNELSFNQETYRVGDVVYIEATERNMDNHVYLIERFWTASDGQQMFYGNWFCRPNETFHLASRKFLEQELFKSDLRSAHPLSQIRGRCCVLNVKEYFSLKPDNFADKDVYVCESRYSTKARMFKKIKVWTSLPTPEVKLTPRETPLEPKRVVSVFRDRVEKHKEELAELGEVEKLAEKVVQNVEAPAPSPPPADAGASVQQPAGLSYYQQLTIPGHTLRTGDCVYVRAENGKQLIAQIDSMWVDAENVAYFHGPWYVTPAEIAHAPNRLFYRQEVFLSSIEDTNPLLSVVGRCTVLDFNDYTTCRPTEVAENDCYLCESLYEESRRQIKKLPRDGLKKYTHSSAVIHDEIYFFRRPIQPQRESSPLLAKLGTGDDLTEDSLDAPPSVGSDSGPATSMTPVTSVSQTPSTIKKPIKCFQKRMVTGYIIYSGEVRKNIAAKNPDATFGEVSRMVGNEWRNLPAHMKSEYEEKSQRINEETAAEMARNGSDPASTSGPSTPSAVTGSHADVIYECCWQKCPWQYEDINDLTDHLLQEPNGHVQSTVNANDSEFQCMWRGCSRIRKGVPPFPKMERLLRHIREVHIQKNQGRVVSPADRSKYFVCSKKMARIAPATGSSASQTHESHMIANPGQMNAYNTFPAAPVGQNNAAPRHCGFEPMFVAVPPKPQRLLHSDAYIKYIEGLHSQSRYISNWDKSMRAQMDHSSIPDVSRLPTHWLASHSRVKSNGGSADVVSTLWALRDYMMKDALNISKMLH